MISESTENRPGKNLSEKILDEFSGNIVNTVNRKKNEMEYSWQKRGGIFQSINHPIIILDPRFRILNINRAAKKIVDETAENFARKYCYEIFHGIDHPPADCPMVKMLKTGTLKETNAKIECNQRTYFISCSPLTDSRGKLEGIIHILTDITEQVKVEKKCAELESQLIQAQRLESVGRLAGGVAHDFNNLLTVILGAGDLLSLKLDNNPLAEKYLKQICDAGMRAKDLTSQLLAFSRKQVLKVDLLDINTFLINVKKILNRLISEDVEIQCKFTNDTTKVEADSAQLEQVLMNLIINASDAMPNGGKLFIETANIEIDEAYAATKNGVTPGKFIMMAVSDTGVGMPPDILNKIFDPFFTTKEKAKGTGLGLSTAYGIIKQHGGNIWAYSEPGHGTTFKIYLPAASNNAVGKKEPAEAYNAVPGAATIMVVEDDAVVREVVCSMLKQNGYNVIESDTPQSAVELSEKHTGDIHLLLTDVVMPDMKGPEVYKLISGIHPETKILYMSGYPEDFISRQGILQDDVQFISKPLTINLLLEKVAESILH